jgi:mono/diheme cytochrome c family protein
MTARTVINQRAAPLFGLFMTLTLGACGGGSGVSPQPPPSGLSYNSPAIAIVGTATNFAPTVTGDVQSYAVSPALPNGLSLNSASGVIGGTPTAVAAQAAYTITASNGAGSTNFQLTLTVNPGAPTALSYAGFGPFLLGKAASFQPTVTGTVTSFSLTPETLPAGLSFSSTSGTISGTPTALAPPTPFTVTASNVTGSTSTTLTVQIDSGPTVHLSATASDPSGLPLSYLWMPTDGLLENTAGSQTDWLLPSGPGIHFAYVLVKNGQGGYAEARVGVNTDIIGNPLQPTPPVVISPPPAPARVGEPMRIPLHLPNVFVYVQGAAHRYPAAGGQLSDKYGQVILQNVNEAPGSTMTPLCSVDGINYTSNPAACVHPNIEGAPVTGGSLWAPVGYAAQLYEATLFSIPGPGAPGADNPNAGQPIGNLQANGASKCGIIDEFFGVDSTATATLTDPLNGALYFNVPVGDRDQFAVPYPGPGQTVTLNCEAMPPITVDYQATTAPVNFPAISEPVINSLTASFNGQQIASLVPLAAPEPADSFPQTNRYLAFPGLDSRISACQYYKAIGATAGCGPDGALESPISFADWRKQVRIDEFAPAGSPPTYTAQFINKVDLNLARAHHSISYGPGDVAAYVCNHLGPTVLDPSQNQDAPNNPSIDTVVANMVAGKNLVACVAMDYISWPGVNDGKPFTRFLIFGPSGQLLPSVNLDGRAEKFVPGACVVCHGGDHYAGAFPSDGTGSPDIGSHFLPYDTGNFFFSDVKGLTEADQTDSGTLSIFHLNQNVLDTAPTAAIQTLITGWYAAGKSLDKNYVSPSWAAEGATTAYQSAYARACRTCHIAMPVPYDFDNYFYDGDFNGPFFDPAVYPYTSAADQMQMAVCGAQGPAEAGDALNNVMPNSAVTFNRFWDSAGSTSLSDPDQVALLALTLLTKATCAKP